MEEESEPDEVIEEIKLDGGKSDGEDSDSENPNP
jgi:hypothetical protein